MHLVEADPEIDKSNTRGRKCSINEQPLARDMHIQLHEIIKVAETENEAKVAH